jgi:hypothetical protein
MTGNEGDPSGKTEPSFNPEAIRERPFRVPSIDRMGDEYRFSNLYIPNGWTEHVTELGGSVPVKKTQVSDYLRVFDYEGLIYNPDSSSVIFDTETGVVRTITIPTLHIGESHVMLQYGMYRASNLHSLTVAAAVLSFVSNHLYFSYPKPFQHDVDSLDGASRRFPRIGIPKQYLDSEKTIVKDYENEHFTEVAHNIAGQFGEKVRKIDFDEKTGLLTYVDVGLANNLFLLTNEAENGWYYYVRNNNHTIYQTVALHAIVAEFVNTVMEKQEMTR